MDLTSLKGEKRVDAILSMADEYSNVGQLLSMASSEKGKAKQAAMEVLAGFEYEPALPLWKKVIKSKSKGEKIFIHSTADLISDLIASEFNTFLTGLLHHPTGYTLTDAELRAMKTFISIMIGKGSKKMRNIFILMAENSDKFSTFNFQIQSGDLKINSYLHFYNPNAADIKKIFPAILSMSILKTSDPRLILLAEDLSNKYSHNWLSPVFLSKLLSEPAEQVFANYSKYLQDESKAMFLYDCFGSLYYDQKKDRHVGILSWGQYIYGEIDVRFATERKLSENLDERWFDLLIRQRPEKISLQAYNRGGVLYEAFDEMITEILPKKFQDLQVEQNVKAYFIKREEQHDGASTLYLDALKILNCEVSEEMLQKFINCKDNAVSKYSLKSEIDKYTKWSPERKLAFYLKQSSSLLLDDEIIKLQNLI